MRYYAYATMTMLIVVILWANNSMAIRIDGELNEPEWNKAQDFTFKAGDFFIKPLVLWDETYFYFGCIIPDPNVEGKHKEGIQNVWEDNDVEYYLETDNKKFAGRSKNSFQLLFSAAGAYNDTTGKGLGGNADYDFNWDSHIEYVVVLEPGTTINDSKDVDKGWRVESRLPWSDMGIKGVSVRGKTMGWNVLYADNNAQLVSSWSPKVNGFSNNHEASNWGEITFIDGYALNVSSGIYLVTTWGDIRSSY